MTPGGAVVLQVVQGGHRVDSVAKPGIAGHVDDALARGAAVVVYEPSAAHPAVAAPSFTVPGQQAQLGEFARAYFARGAEPLTLAGATGTNGKSTVAHLVAQAQTLRGTPCGYLGTLGHGVPPQVVAQTLTTPDCLTLHRTLRSLSVSYAAMEVSSHALAMRRVDRTRFAAAVFSNLTRDHLDYHLDMEHYFGMKRRLFDMLPAGAPAIINTDDPFGLQLVEMVGRPVTYALDRAADVTPDRVESSLPGTSIDVRTPRGRLQLRSSLPGRLNVYNVLAAVSAAGALDVPFQAIEQGVAGLEGVPGRFEMVSSPDDDVRVLVDYAHTDDALRAVLGAVRELCGGRVISVFGCGGDRDTAKRPLMGAVAARLSDLVVVTSDNPRSEDPDRIIDEIRRGIDSSTTAATGPPHLGITDRRTAIERAIDEAEPGDAVVIAGKGHETYQVVGDERRPFDDRLVARAALARRRARPRVS